MKNLLLYLFLILFSNAFGQHYKKDGTPDRRYKENRSPSYKTSSSYKTSPSSSYKSSYSKKRNYSYSARRDKRGRIKRSNKARHDFMKQSGYPKGRKGYVIDHIVPLKDGGCDCPANMQWQTKEAAKAKDKWETP